MVTEKPHNYHSVVVAGLHGDGTPAGSQLLVHDPYVGVAWHRYPEFELTYEWGSGCSLTVLHR